MTTSYDAAPPKKSIPIWQALIMMSIISVFWVSAGCLGAWIAFNGLVAQAPRLVSDMYADMIGNVVDDYMTYMYYRDANAAYALFTKGSASFEDINAQVTDHYEWFDGYLQIDVTEAEGLPEQSLNDNQSYNELMAGRVVTLRGNIEYEEGFTGTYVAVLSYVTEGEYWELNSIEITVPPEKVEALND